MYQVGSKLAIFFGNLRVVCNSRSGDIHHTINIIPIKKSE